MPKKQSITYYLQANGGTSGTVSIYTVEPARVFKTASVYVSFPAGTYSELEVSIRRGEMQIAPTKGTYRGDANVIEDEFIEDVESAERIILYYKNNNTTQTRECFIIVRGELT